MRRILFAIVLILFSAPAICQTTGHRQITMLRTGWNGDYFAVVTNEDSLHPDQLMNPANCPVKDGYVSVSTSPGYSTYYAAALTAYSLGQSADITVDNTPGSCALGRPTLIGINIGVAPSPVAPPTPKICKAGTRCCGDQVPNGCLGDCLAQCR
jgi:hypothetical protein